MSLFRRALRFLFLVLGVVAGMVTALVYFFARLMIRPARQPLWSNPADLGLAFENIEFPARDGVRLSGWFIPAVQQPAGRRKTLILLHGWPWNRLGTTAENILIDVPGAEPVNLLYLAHALHRAGYHLLMFDLRNHGQSAASPPVTFGLKEANDLLGAIDYLAGRNDVDGEQIGAVGFSTGASAILYALTQTRQIQAAVAVQPSSPTVFTRRYAAYLLGPLGAPIVGLTNLIYQLIGGLRLEAIEPIFAAAGTGAIPILYIQGKGDPWGAVENVAQMAAVSPAAAPPLFIESSSRAGGYHFAIDHPEIITNFFDQFFS